MKLFIPLVGEFANVGDVMHRRQLLSWFNGCCQLHVYVGNAPESFIQSLKLAPDTVVYKSLFRWLFCLLFSLGHGTSFIFNPGEINYRARRLMGEFLLLPFTALIRLFGGKVFRIGIAAKSNKASAKWIWRLIFKLSSKIYWRTSASRDYIGFGYVIPDLAFAEASTKKQGDENTQQKFLTISMRVDRPFPSDNWFTAILEVAKILNLNIVVVSQVWYDNERTELIANRLQAKAIIWPHNIIHSDQEEVVRDVYAKSALVISDRLHVLIAGVTEFASPAVILTSGAPKVEDHFSAIGYSQISINDMDVETKELVEFLLKQTARKTDLVSAVKKAQSNLLNIKNEVLTLLHSSRH